MTGSRAVASPPTVRRGRRHPLGPATARGLPSPHLQLGPLRRARWSGGDPGARRLATVTTAAVAIGGGLTWLLGGGGNHIGASGVVFGYLGALLGAAVFERRPAAVAPALVALLLYGTMLVGFVPQPGISWEGHLFGFVAGLLASKSLAEPRTPTPDYDFPD